MKDEPYEDIAQMFTDKFMQGNPHARLVHAQINEMLKNRNTNKDKLRDALIDIGEKCRGNQGMILKCMGKLHLEFAKRNNYFFVDLNLG